MIIFGTDFDDTLYFHDGRGIQDADAKAIKNFQKGGDQFGLVSGRGRVMRPLLDRLIDGKVTFDFAVYSNGACICDKNGNILKEWFLPVAIVRELYDKYAKDVILIFHGQNELYLTAEKTSIPGIIISSLDDFDPSKIYAISFSHLTPEGKKLFDENLGRTDVVMVSNSRFTDFGPVGVSKGKGLNYIAHTLYGEGCTSAAIGDSWNDLPMLEAADVSFTFHSSPEDVKEAATYLTDSVAEAIAQVKQNEVKQQA